MTPDVAFSWLAARLGVSRETFEKLDRYRALVEDAQETQNLVSASTMPKFWARHVVDSAQLILSAPRKAGATWMDIGSGAGIPGLINAIITSAPTTLVEPRARRAEFLSAAVEALDLRNVEVVQLPIGKLFARPFDVITARAVAPLLKLIVMATPFAHSGTLWLFPKGKGAQGELESLPDTWQGDWELQKSVTDEESYILVGRRIRMGSKA